MAKAFGAGADFVMMGGMLAGHDQSGGEVVVKQNGTKVKLFYGMSSATAMQKHSGGVAEYRWAANKMLFNIIVCPLVQGQRGQDGGGALPRRRERHDPGRVGRHQVRLHLHRGRQAQGDAQEDNLHQSQPATQRDF